MSNLIVRTSLFLSIAILFLLIPHSHSLSPTQELINKICRSTYDYGFCAKIFNDHLYTPNTDIKGLTQIAITQTLIHGTDTLKYVVQTINSERNEELRNLYKICEVGYENLVREFTDATLAFAKGDYRNMLFSVRKCDRFVSDCTVVMGNRASPQLAGQNIQNRELVEMSLFSGLLIGQ